MSEEALQSIAQQYLSLADLLTDSSVCLFDDEAYEGRQGILLYIQNGWDYIYVDRKSVV